MKKLTIDIWIILFLLFLNLALAMAERMIREHLTIVDVLQQFIIPTIIVGAIINVPIWLAFRKPKDES